MQIYNYYIFHKQLFNIVNYVYFESPLNIKQQIAINLPPHQVLIQISPCRYFHFTFAEENLLE